MDHIAASTDWTFVREMSSSDLDQNKPSNLFLSAVLSVWMTHTHTHTHTHTYTDTHRTQGLPPPPPPPLVLASHRHSGLSAKREDSLVCLLCSVNTALCFPSKGHWNYQLEPSLLTQAEGRFM